MDQVSHDESPRTFDHANEANMSFNFETVKDILVCPQSHAPLVLDADRLVSTDRETRLAYPIIDDIPCLLADEAEAISMEDWTVIMDRNDFDPTAAKSTASE